MNPFDKQIHKDDFRLRLLVTNGCNKNCHHCLNDFQPKPRNRMRFLDPKLARGIIKEYCLLMAPKAQVEISGGEPGIYPYLGDLVGQAKIFGGSVKVNTNGMAFSWGIEDCVDRWHIGVTKCDRHLAEKTKEVGGQIQFVVISETPNRIRSIVEFYGSYGIPIKLFVDFFAYGEEKKEIEGAIKAVIGLYPNLDITTRYTGVQENRGAWCDGCNKKCITLKALWVFPDGRVSPCPQGIIPPKTFHPGDIELVRLGHLKKEIQNDIEEKAAR